MLTLRSSLIKMRGTPTIMSAMDPISSFPARSWRLAALRLFHGPKSIESCADFTYLCFQVVESGLQQQKILPVVVRSECMHDAEGRRDHVLCPWNSSDSGKAEEGCAHVRREEVGRDGGGVGEGLSRWQDLVDAIPGESGNDILLEPVFHWTRNEIPCVSANLPAPSKLPRQSRTEMPRAPDGKETGAGHTLHEVKLVNTEVPLRDVLHYVVVSILPQRGRTAVVIQQGVDVLP